MSGDEVVLLNDGAFMFPNDIYATYEGMMLYYDIKHCRIGFHFVKTKGEHTSGLSGGKSFFKHFNIDARECAGHYVWKKERAGRLGYLYVIDLNEPVI